MITPSAQLTLTKGNKSWSSTAVAAALELVDPLALDLGCHSLRPLFFFFFFFFFFFWHSPPYIIITPIPSSVIKPVLLRQDLFGLPGGSRSRRSPEVAECTSIAHRGNRDMPIEIFSRNYEPGGYYYQVCHPARNGSPSCSPAILALALGQSHGLHIPLPEWSAIFRRKMPLALPAALRPFSWPAASP
eukprot:FR736481.1.p1 GENE.FR736481.1~~FR736481.1.p1  ORF type:complete len:188 (-),score=28.42 FR736481.1:182-745(-)